MKARKVKAMFCQCCSELIDADDLDLLETHGLEEAPEAYICGECEQIYEDRDEAKECCK